jgi:hypothetical protein
MSIISWVFGLFSKPHEEVSFDDAVKEAWPFPVESEKAEKLGKPKRKYVRKTATKKPAAKKVAKKKVK